MSGMGELMAEVQATVAAKPDVKALAVFDGTLPKWKNFRDRFLAVATSQQMVALLLLTYKVPSNQELLERHRNANRFLVSGLLYSTAGGTAVTIVKKYSATQNGRLAWLTLPNWYEGQGSKNIIAHRTMKDLQTLKLTRDTIGGAEAYISKFEDSLVSLEETGYPYQEGMKKINFLNGIEDITYSALVDVLSENDDKTYEECILAIRKKSVDVEENCNPRRPLCRVAQASIEQQVQCNLRRLPDSLWIFFSDEQKSQYQVHMWAVKTSIRLLS